MKQQMKITFWGTRGSIPVPDSRMITYGGNTACLEIVTGDSVLIIDAGTGIRKLGEDLLRRNIRRFSLFLTHSHWDHIQGFPFFPPIYSARTHISIFGCTNSYKPLRDILKNQMSYEYFPISFSELTSKISFMETCNSGYRVGDHHVTTIRANHPAFTLGVKVTAGNRSFVFITDNELKQSSPATPWKDFVAFCKNADYLVHDAQFTEREYRSRRGWGHSTFEQALALAHEAGVRHLGFFHHDPNREDTALAALEKKYAAAAPKGLDVFAVKEMQSLTLSRR